MRICYIISTCNKYLNNRVSYQMKTFLKDVNNQDIFYLTSQPCIEKRQFGWYTMDDEKNITWKYIHFIYNMDGDFLNYDWYIFIDDDTFVFTNRLHKYLKQYNPEENYYIGYECEHKNWELCFYLSGGAGYAISNALYKKIYNYIKTEGINNAYKHWCDDLCVGMWIDEISKNSYVNRIHNSNFLVSHFKNINELDTAITAHQISTYKDNLLCYNLLQLEVPNNITSGDTIFALVTDYKYFSKAKRSIIDLRSRGNWRGPIALITIDFDLNANFADFYNVTEVKFDTIDKTQLLQLIGENGFSDGDKRELNKLNQWEKLHIFDDFFTQWNRVVYLDAGLRVLDDVSYLLELDYKDCILAPQDGKINAPITFNTQISYDNKDLVAKLVAEYGSYILQSNHMLNCVWIYDTNILKICNKLKMIEAMNKWPLCKSNEMTIMNLLLNFKYKLWKPFPINVSNGKILFDWSELNSLTHITWKKYCLIKYSVTINFEDC